MDDVANTVTAATEYEESPEDAVKRLAALSKMEFESVREAEAKKLGWRKSVLGELVDAARPDNKSSNDLDLYDPDPWPEEIDGDDLLDRITAAIREYVILPEHAAEAAALWVVHTHCFDAWQVTPRLAISAPTMGSGKSVLLDVLGGMVPRAFEVEGLTPAVAFRIIEKYRPTLMVDEVDTFIRDHDELRGILNSGYSAGGKIPRCEGDNYEIRTFSTHAPLATAGIGRLPGTLADRSIHIELQRKKPSERTREFRRDRIDHLRELAQQAARWTQDNRDALCDHEPEMPDGIFNRKADNWRPFLAIADTAGGDWPERAREAAVALSTSDADNAESQRVQLLEDCRTILTDIPGDKVKTKELLSRLQEMEDRPWSDYRRGKPIGARHLGDILRSFKINPGTHRFDDGDRVKGYVKADFEDVFARYLALSPLSIRDAVTSQESRGLQRFSIRDTEKAVTDTNPPKTAETVGCHGVTDRNPQGGDEGANGRGLCVRCGEPIERAHMSVPCSGGAMHAGCHTMSLLSAAENAANEHWDS